MRSTVAVFDGERTTSLWERASAPADPAAAEADLRRGRDRPAAEASARWSVSGSLPPGVRPTCRPIWRGSPRRGVPCRASTSRRRRSRRRPAVPRRVLTPNADELAAARSADDPVRRRVRGRAALATGAPARWSPRSERDGLVVATPARLLAVPRSPGRSPGNPTGAGDAVGRGRRRAAWPTAAVRPRSLRDAVALAAAASRSPIAGEVDLAATAQDDRLEAAARRRWRSDAASTPMRRARPPAPRPPARRSGRST